MNYIYPMRLCRFNLLTISCALFVMLFLFTPVQGQQIKVKQADIRVGVFSVEPLSIIDERGNVSGLFPNLIREISKKSGQSVIFVPGTWAEGLGRLQTGEIDLMFCVAYSEERDRIMDFNRESVVELWSQVFVTRENSSININDLHQKRVGVMSQDINGKNYIQTAANLGIESIIVEYPDHASIFEAVSKEEVFAGVTPQHFGLVNAGNYGLIPSSILFSPFSIYFAAKEGHMEDLLNRIDLILAEWKDDRNSFYYINQSYWLGGHKNPLSYIPLWLILVSLFLGAAALIFLLFVYLLKRQVKINLEKIKERDQLYRDLVQNAGSIIMRLDGEGKIIFMNSFGRDIFGFSPSENLKGMPADFLFQNERLKEHYISFPLHDILSDPVLSNEFKHCESTYYSPLSSDRNIKWNNRIFEDENHRVKEVLCIGLDITANKFIEDKLRQSEKLGALGQLAGGIAHDFNNRLSSIIGFTELLKDQIVDEEEKKYLDYIYDNAKKSAQLTGRMLSFARKSQYKPVSVDLNELVKNAVGLFERSMAKNIKLDIRTCPENCRIIGDHGQWENALLNLLINARDAMPEGGTITITTKKMFLNEGEKVGNRTVDEKGSHVSLTVSDQGMGIEESDFNRIMEPFYTTKDEGKGTGMGLAMINAAVNEQKGYFFFESERGKGSSFHIILKSEKLKA